MKLIFFCFFISFIIGSALLFYEKNFEFDILTDKEMKCFIRCNRIQKAAIMVDFLKPTECFCGTEYEAKKKLWPKKLKKDSYGKERFK